MKDKKIKHIEAFIISGGKSSRFGEDKSFFKYHGKALIKHVIDVISPIFDNITIIANDRSDYKKFGYPVISDIIIGKGPMGGLYTALTKSGSRRIFLFPCDMPCLSRDLIIHMAEKSEKHDVIIPLTRKGCEPLHAVYSVRCLDIVTRMIENNELSLLNIYDRTNVLKISEDEISVFGDPNIIFKNINQIDDAV
jgi:molybdopterin-guanine dinucleotide biosynthesis protein A